LFKSSTSKLLQTKLNQPQIRTNTSSLKQTTWLPVEVLSFLGGFITSQLLPSSAGETVHHHNSLPGEERPLLKKALDTSAGWLQSFHPIKQIHLHLSGFHFYNGDMNRQVEAHHFCTHLNEDVAQCLIYESNKPNARLLGIEYVITERLFKTLPPEEQKLWHNHVYEVKSGMLTAPGLPEVAEHKVMEDLVHTYGKTFHLWQVDRGDLLPLGVPKLMMAYTKDGQLKEEYLRRRDRRDQVNTVERRKLREDIETPVIHPSADSWQTGPPLQTYLDDARKHQNENPIFLP